MLPQFLTGFKQHCTRQIFDQFHLWNTLKLETQFIIKSMEIIRTIGKGAELGGKDPDHIVKLCNEVVQEGHSVLLFCSSRKGCESTATHIAKYLKKFCQLLQQPN